MPESDRGAEMRREGNVYGRVGGLEGRTFQEEIENWTGKGLGGRKPEEPKDTRGNQSELGVGGGGSHCQATQDLTGAGRGRFWNSLKDFEFDF